MYFRLFAQNILRALKQNFIPGLILQTVALGVASCYFFWPDSRVFFSFFGDLKATHGWLYSMISTAIFAGIIPFLYLYFTRQIQQSLVKVFLFYIVFWSIKGVEVDFFYQLQGFWFGNELNFETIFKKVMVDQFIYSALWAAPGITIVYLWKDCNFSFSALRKNLNQELFTLKIPTTVISNWLVWIPAVSIIYTMPPPLQIPLFNLVLCFFVLLLASLTKNHSIS